MYLWTKSSDHRYSKVEGMSDSSATDDGLEAAFHPATASRFPRYLLYLAFVVFTNLITLLIDRRLLHKFEVSNSAHCSDERSPSPFLSEIDRSWHVETFSELNFAKSTDSEYTRPGTMGDDVAAEVDRYWADLGTYEVELLVPERYGVYHNISAEKYNHSLTGPWEPNTPYIGYPVEIQVAHMLHCLNLIRQGQWYNIEWSRKHSPSFLGSQWNNKVNGQSIIEAHSGHCIEQIRQYLMCDVDIRLVPFGDLDSNELGPQPIFAQQKQCRNFDSFWRWLQVHKWDQNPKNHGERGHVPPVISFSGLPGTFHE